MAANPAVGIVGASGMVGKFLTNGFLEDGSFAVTLLTRKVRQRRACRSRRSASHGRPTRPTRTCVGDMQGGASKLADFEARGAKVVEVDFTDPAALTAALAGKQRSRPHPSTEPRHSRERGAPQPLAPLVTWLAPTCCGAGCSPLAAGLETVMSAVGMEGLQGQVDVIKAAKAAGVKRFVPSEFGMDASSPLVR